MARTLLCDIVTPERKLYSSEANFVAVPATDGEIGILPMHVPLVSTLKFGEVRVKHDGQESSERFAVAGGYVQVSNDKVIVLADRAARVSEIDSEALKASVEELMAKVATLKEGDSASLYLHSELEWCNLQLELAGRA